MTIERYGIYWVDLNPTTGREMSKNRPAVVVSDNQMNKTLQTVIICPLTTTVHARWPSRIQTAASGTEAEIAVDQIRTISRARMGKRVGMLAKEEAEALRHVITVMYGVLAE